MQCIMHARSIIVLAFADDTSYTTSNSIRDPGGAKLPVRRVAVCLARTRAVPKSPRLFRHP